jgi:hypothetical protein
VAVRVCKASSELCRALAYNGVQKGGFGQATNGCRRAIGEARKDEAVGVVRYVVTAGARGCMRRVGEGLAASATEMASFPMPMTLAGYRRRHDARDTSVA